MQSPRKADQNPETPTKRKSDLCVDEQVKIAKQDSVEVESAPSAHAVADVDDIKDSRVEDKIEDRSESLGSEAAVSEKCL